MMNKILQIALVLLVAMLASSCGTSRQEIGEARATTFAKSLIAEMNKGNYSKWELSMDAEALVNRMPFDWYIGNIDDQDSFKVELAEQIGEQTTLLSDELMTQSSRTKLAFNRYYKDDMGEHMVVRSFNNTGINFFDYLIYEKEDTIRIEDMYFVTQGQWLSETFDELLIPQANVDKVLGLPVEGKIDTVFVRNWRNGNTMMSIAQQGPQWLEFAAGIYDSMTNDYQKKKSVQLIRLQILGAISDSAFDMGVMEYKKMFAVDEALILQQLSRHLQREDAAQILQTVLELERIVGEDASLAFYKANALASQKKYAEAMPLYEVAAAELNDFQEISATYMLCALNIDDFQKAISLGEVLATKFMVSRADINEFYQGYEKLMDSQVYQDWKAKAGIQ